MLFLKRAAESVGWSASVVDAYFDDLSAEVTASRIVEDGPLDVLGFTLNSELMHRSATEIIKIVTAQIGFSPIVVAGGHYATAEDHRLLTTPSCFDFVVRGEGETALMGLLDTLATKASSLDVPGVSHVNSEGVFVRNRRAPPIRETALDEFGNLDWRPVSLVVQRHEWSLVTSRGCSARCAFCLIGPHWSRYGHWRGHSAEWVLEQLEHFVHDEGAEFIQIVDDQFIGTAESVHRAWHVVRGMRTHSLSVPFNFMCRSDTVVEHPRLLAALAEVGLKSVFMGIETSRPDIADRLTKDSNVATDREAVRILDGLGIVAQSGTIVFHPWMTERTIRDDIRFFRGLLRKHSRFTILGLNELDIFARTALGGRYKHLDFHWRYDWADGSEPIHRVYFAWTTYQTDILFPLLDQLTCSGIPARGRTIACLQLDVLDRILDWHISDGSYPALITALSAMTHSYFARLFGHHVLSATVTLNPSPNQISERCFERVTVDA